MVPHSIHFAMAIYGKGDIVSSTIERGGSWETKATDSLNPYVRPDTVFVDIGANIGWYTFVMAARNHSVVAFEPFAKNVELQKTTLCLNPKLAQRVTQIPHGLAESEQQCDLVQVPSVNFGDTHSVCGTPEEVAARTARWKKNG